MPPPSSRACHYLYLSPVDLHRGSVPAHAFDPLLRPQRRDPLGFFESFCRSGPVPHATHRTQASGRRPQHSVSEMAHAEARHDASPLSATTRAGVTEPRSLISAGVTRQSRELFASVTAHGSRDDARSCVHCDPTNACHLPTEYANLDDRISLRKRYRRHPMRDRSPRARRPAKQRRHEIPGGYLRRRFGGRTSEGDAAKGNRQVLGGYRRVTEHRRKEPKRNNNDNGKPKIDHEPASDKTPDQDLRKISIPESAPVKTDQNAAPIFQNETVSSNESWKQWLNARFPLHISTATPVSYDTTLAIKNGDTIVRVASQKSYVGTLDPIVTSTLDYSALRAIGDDRLNFFIDMLDDVHAFEGQLKVMPEEIPGYNRGISRHMLHHTHKLREWDVMMPALRVRIITNIFTVLKKNEALRLIVDARRLNNIMAKPPHMDLPTVPEVIDILLRASHFCTVDGRSYFYQFGIAEEVGQFFCAHVSGTKGRFVPLQMTRMPMGWSWAPAIAQHTSNVLLDHGRLGLAWIDNFIFWGNSEDEVNGKLQQFLSRARDCNLMLDTTEPPIVTAGEILGVEVDLVLKTFRLASDWVQKVANLEVKAITTPREIYTLTGNGVWHSYITGKALCRYNTAMSLIRKVANLVWSGMLWDDPLEIAPIEVAELQKWKRELTANSWNALPVKVVPEVHLWSDASDVMWAYLTEGELDPLFDKGIFPDERWHIFVKEAYAAHKVVQATAGIQRRLHVDNQALYYATRKRVSSHPLVNLWFQSWDWENLQTEWVSTQTKGRRLHKRGGNFCKHLTESHSRKTNNENKNY
eukprot:PhM_4_TR10041/c2_g2_i1/m.99261